MGKYIEKFFPALLSVIFTILICIIPIHSIINMKDIVLSIITFVSILIGFLTTMLSVLITAIDSSVMKYLKKIGKIKDLYIFLADPILEGFLLIIICLTVIPISEVDNLKHYLNYYLLVLLFIYFILSCVRAIIILLLLIFRFINENKDDDKNIDEEDNLDLSNAFNEDR